MEKLFRFRTNLSSEEAATRSSSLGETIRDALKTKSFEVGSAIVPSDKYPVIVVINALGGSGKGTFCKTVRYSGFESVELSCVYPTVDQVVTTLIAARNEEFPNLFAETPMTAAQHRKAKTPEWRTLMHLVKTAWTSFDDGPNVHTIARIIDLITNPLAYVVHDDATGGDSIRHVREGDIIIPSPSPDFIFVNIREAENITHFVNAIHGLGLIGIKVLITGRVEHSDFLEDQTVLDQTYDVIIDNGGSTYDLWQKASIFGLSAESWNAKNGAGKK